MSLEDSTAETLERVAAMVADALGAAGLPWAYGEKPLDHDVAQVIVDDSENAGRGVFVSWTLSVEENSAMHALVEAGDFSNPAILEADDKFQTATDRIRMILGAAGIEAVDAENDFDPYLLKVVSAPGVA